MMRKRELDSSVAARRELVTTVKPTQATLVPDSPGQRTSDHGWDAARDNRRLVPIVSALRDEGIRVSLFMNPDPQQFAPVAETGADRIELYTEAYARANRDGLIESVLPQYVAAASEAGRLNLGINAGHDLNHRNLGPFIENVPSVLEVSIGHELTADALWLGLAETVKTYLSVLEA